MSYYFLYHKKGIPSWLAYFLILVLTVGLSLTFKNTSTPIISRADKNLIPQSITISNLTNESASVHFITNKPARTYLSYSKDAEAPVVKFDQRDLEAQSYRKLHYFQLSQLKPNSNYNFHVFVEGKKISKNYTFKTLNLDFPKLGNAPIFGKVLLSDLNPAKNILVKVKISPSNDYSYTTLTKSTGEWISTLPIVLNEKKQEVQITPDQVIEMEFVNQDLKKSKVKVKYADCQPLRSVILGKNYDFTTDSVLGVKKQNNKDLIAFPTNNSIINSFFPMFRGYSQKNTLLSLVIEPDVANLLVTADQTGNWKYSLPQEMAPGKYKLTVKNQSQKQTVNFTIGKSGESVLGDATLSATITVNPTETTANPTIEPTTQLTPTPTRELPASVTPTPEPQIPELGFSNNLLILLASGLSLLGLFLVLY